MQLPDTYPFSLVSKIYSAASIPSKLHVYIRQKTAPLNIFFVEPYKTGNLLEYGCGHGVLLAHYKQLVPQVKLYGLDHDERKVKIVNLCLPDVEIIEPQFLAQHFADYFDYVVICDMLYCNSRHQQEKILSDIYKCMKPRGKLLIKETVSTPKMKYYISLFQEFVVMRVLQLTKGNAMNLPPKEHYTLLLNSCGFKNISDRPVHTGFLHPHHMFMCTK